MPLDFDPLAGALSGLSKGARAAYPFIRGLAISRPDLGATAIYDQLRQAGIPLGKQRTLDLVSIIRNKSDLVRFQRTFGSNTIIPDSLHTYDPVGFKKGTRVLYTIGVKSSNPLIPDTIYIPSSQNLSINDVIGGALATLAGPYFGESVGYQAADVSQITIEDARYAPGQTGTGEFIPPGL